MLAMSMGAPRGAMLDKDRDRGDKRGRKGIM